MGLEEFTNDAKTESSSSNDDNIVDNSDSNNSSSTGGSGIDAFMTDPTTGSNDTVMGVLPSKWNNMSVDQKVRTARDNGWVDYKPEFTVEDWEFQQGKIVSCVCGDIVPVINKNNCSTCSREYTSVGRTVELTENDNE